MRVSLVSIALANAVAGCGSDGALVTSATRGIGGEFVGGRAVGPDVFEVEVHTGHTVLFEVEVSG